jgi:uncharacterized protein (DUF58 family)
VDAAERVAADARLRRLELTVLTRLGEGPSGEHAGFAGSGFEPDDARPYVAGDDIRRIDWLATARSAETQVRPAVGDSELSCIIVVDGSASMSTGSGRWTKAEVAAATAAVFGFMAGNNGARVGGIVARPDSAKWVPPAVGVGPARRLLREINKPFSMGRGDMANALVQAGRLTRRKGMIIVVSDFLDDGAWGRPLLALAKKHDVVCVVIADTRDREVPPVGLVRVRDPETGEITLLEIDQTVADAFAEESRRRDRVRDVALARSRCRVIDLDTVRDPVEDLLAWTQHERLLAKAGSRR